MSYLIVSESHHGGRIIDERRQFAVDFAKELGGNVLMRRATAFTSSSAITSSSSAPTTTKSASTFRFSAQNRHGVHGDQAPIKMTDSATINPEARPIASIAKDIRKRVIEANAPALAARRAYAAAKVKAASDLAGYAEQLRKAVPNLRVEVKGETASVSSTGLYLYARLESYGKVSIDRIESIPVPSSRGSWQSSTRRSPRIGHRQNEDHATDLPVAGPRLQSR
jgi:hypothetical protein